MLGGFGHALGPDHGLDGAAFVLKSYGVTVGVAIGKPGALRGEEFIQRSFVVRDQAALLSCCASSRFFFMKPTMLLYVAFN